MIEQGPPGVAWTSHFGMTKPGQLGQAWMRFILETPLL